MERPRKEELNGNYREKSSQGPCQDEGQTFVRQENGENYTGGGLRGKGASVGGTSKRVGSLHDSRHASNRGPSQEEPRFPSAGYADRIARLVRNPPRIVQVQDPFPRDLSGDGSDFWTKRWAMNKCIELMDGIEFRHPAMNRFWYLVPGSPRKQIKSDGVASAGRKKSE